MDTNIGFLIRSPHDYFVCKNVFHYLRDKGISGVNFIVKRIHSIPMVEPYADKFYEYICKMMDDRGEEYIADPDYSWVMEGNHKVIIYNNNGIFCDTKKVRMLYSQAKENMTFGRLACGEYDLILTYGERSDNYCKQFKPTTVIGSPKYDDWFSNNVNMIEAEQYMRSLDIEKKTVLYIPTWGEIGSADTYYDALNSLIGKYNVILKCHDSLYWREREKLDKFDTANMLVLNGNADIQVLFKLADVVVGDNSGAMMESIYVDKPTIFLEVEQASHSTLTSNASIEQVCRHNFLCVDDPASINKLQEHIDRSISNPGEFKDKRYEVTSTMYAYRDGKCAGRAGDAILKVLGE